jgi:hypothetical protein
MAVPMPAILALMGYEEMKDLDQANGFLFVPVDDPDEGEQVTGIASSGTSDLDYRGFYQITEIPHTSFAAFNPHDGYLYVSRPTVSNQEPLRRFEVHFDVLLANGNVEDAFKPVLPFNVTIDPPLEKHAGRSVHALGRPVPR